jgi:hypothetical protein
MTSQRLAGKGQALSSRLLFATAVAVATASVLACLSSFRTAPQVARASTSARTRAVSGQSFGYPVKPFDQEHPIRANLGDPRMHFFGPPTLRTLMHGKGSFSFHEGIDIAAPNGTAVYPVADGTVSRVSSVWVRVESSDGRAFAYWHIRPLVRQGDHVTSGQTVLGHILRPAGHVHLTEYQDGSIVNPLAPGRLTPYHDSTRPTVRSIALRRTDSGRDLFPTFVRGRVEIVADAHDTPTMAVEGAWNGLPTTPALVSWRIQKVTGQVIVPERIAVDYRTTAPANSDFWHVYARGSYQNMCVFGRHYAFMQRGAYLFKLAQLDTRSLRDGVYELVVTASDIRGNSAAQSLRLTVHNRRGWS